MKSTKLIFISGLALLLIACSPKITTKLTKAYQPLAFSENVMVYSLEEQAPISAENLATVKIGDSGFTTDCSMETVLEKAKLEARKIGGNAIKIIKHTPPNLWGSSCHQITALILKADANNLKNDASISKVDSAMLKSGYALIHIYRHSGMGALVGYDLHLADSVICRVSNKSKTTVKVTKDGLMSLWARTEVKKEIPLEVKFGYEYYIRCGLEMGAFVGRPSIELVDKQTGKYEFESIKTTK